MLTFLSKSPLCPGGVQGEVDRLWEMSKLFVLRVQRRGRQCLKTELQNRYQCEILRFRARPLDSHPDF